ncbi:MAG: hypothetical protein F4Y91_03555 [Gemmatimonadetes bacterium]|nr:hypothetical protein [Gemmatimonadota bacterium]MXY81152.1 hypothetical protein [Gemmatimonadota bacterium]MYB71945.1 hypothetical protein [Gemmatimonadota bacterium]
MPPTIRDEQEIDKKSIDRGLLDEVWQFAYMLATVRHRCLPQIDASKGQNDARTNKEQGEETR